MNLVQECYYSDYQNSGIPKKKKNRRKSFSLRRKRFSASEFPPILVMCYHLI